MQEPLLITENILSKVKGSTSPEVKDTSQSPLTSPPVESSLKLTADSKKKTGVQPISVESKVSKQEVKPIEKTTPAPLSRLGGTIKEIPEPLVIKTVISPTAKVAEKWDFIQPLSPNRKETPVTIESRAHALSPIRKEAPVTIETKVQPLSPLKKEAPVTIEAKVQPLTQLKKEVPVTKETNVQPLSPLKKEVAAIETKVQPISPTKKDVPVTIETKVQPLSPTTKEILSPMTKVAPVSIETKTKPLSSAGSKVVPVSIETKTKPSSPAVTKVVPVSIETKTKVLSPVTKEAPIAIQPNAKPLSPGVIKDAPVTIESKVKPLSPVTKEGAEIKADPLCLIRKDGSIAIETKSVQTPKPLPDLGLSFVKTEQSKVKVPVTTVAPGLATQAPLLVQSVLRESQTQPTSQTAKPLLIRTSSQETKLEPLKIIGGEVTLQQFANVINSPLPPEQKPSFVPLTASKEAVTIPSSPKYVVAPSKIIQSVAPTTVLPSKVQSEVSKPLVPSVGQTKSQTAEVPSSAKVETQNVIVPSKVEPKTEPQKTVSHKSIIPKTELQKSNTPQGTKTGGVTSKTSGAVTSKKSGVVTSQKSQDKGPVGVAQQIQITEKVILPELTKPVEFKPSAISTEPHIENKEETKYSPFERRLSFGRAGVVSPTETKPFERKSPSRAPIQRTDAPPTSRVS